ncbi:Protein TRM32 [Morella rubra]|uniref:Protein TRM32 n=1 Tax=Morella rubra TaxID=262757 RepID=A0A6A1VR19_9ROSI|nr:Protein TRM32 [Morella rubra]
MGKRSQRRPVRYEKDQSGCMWGLISLFDFRQGRSTKRLLSDRKPGGSHAAGAGYSRNKFELLTDLDENHQGTLNGYGSTTAAVTADAGKPSVKKLIEEEMFSEQNLKKENSDAEVEQKSSKSGHESSIKTESKRTKKSRKKSHDMDNHELDAAKNLEFGCSCNQNAETQSIGNIRIDEIIEEFSQWIHQKSLGSTKHDLDDEVQMQSNQKHSELDRLREAIKELINHKCINSKHLKENGNICHPKELTCALEILSSDEELLQKLIKDPNSPLAKYALNFQDTRIEKGDEPNTHLSELELGSLEQSGELVNQKHQRSFFRRKVRAQEKTPLKQNENSEASNRIVILKPGPPGLRNSRSESSFGSAPKPHYIVGDKGPAGRVGTNFFLAEIKRKWKSARGKEWNGISTMAASDNSCRDLRSFGDSKRGIDMGNSGKFSPSKESSYIERSVKPAIGVKKGDKTGQLKDSEMRVEHETDSYPKQRVTDIYIEAKKHLCDMLINGDEGVDFTSKQVPKSLGRILSLPEYNLSPMDSPARDWEDKFGTGQMRFSACSEIQKVKSNKWSPKRENNVSLLGQATQNLESSSCISNSLVNNIEALHSKQNVSENLFPDNGVEGTFASASDEMSPKGTVDSEKATEVIVEEDISVVHAHSDLTSSSTIRNDQNADTSVTCDHKEYCESLKQQESYEEKQVPFPASPSPSSCLISKKDENLESTVDMPERPSPVSVLEPPFTEDDISPTKSIPRLGKPPLQPLRIQFEEHDSSAADQVSCAKVCMDDKEIVFEYIKEVLEACGLNWDEFCAKCLTSDQLLDPSLLEEVEYFPNQLCYERKCLLDCTNEVLLEVCWHHFGCCPWVSFLQPTIKSIPDMKNAIHEVWEGISWHLLPLPLPHTLDQMVRKDMARIGTWMDLRLDVDAIGVETCEAILEDLMKDLVLSCLNENPERNPESGNSAVLTELENSSSINL